MKMHFKRSLSSYTNIVIASLFFFYTFGLYDIFNTSALQIMAENKISPVQLGYISSCYFYGNILFLIPAGLMTDRYPLKKIFLFSMLLSSTFTLLSGVTNNLYILCMLRLLGGICASFSFISCIKLAAATLPVNSLSKATAVIATTGMLGGYVSQQPLSSLLKYFPFDKVLFIIGAIGLLITVIQWLFLRVPNIKSSNKTIMNLDVKSILLKKINILAAIYTGLMNLPIYILATLWGIPFLKIAQHDSTSEAANITSMLFVGTIIGMPVAGYLADKLKSRIIVMKYSAIIALLLSMLIIQTYYSFHMELLYFFLLGFTTSAQVLSYPLVLNQNPLKSSALATSVISIISLLLGAIMQPAFGMLLSMFEINNKITSASYNQAVYCLPVIFILALVTIRYIKES